MVARIFCRSLSWIGWVGLVTAAGAAGAAGVGGVVMGEVPVAAEGVVGVVGTWEEPIRVAAEVEEGVAAADWLRELKKRDGCTMITSTQYQIKTLLWEF